MLPAILLHVTHRPMPPAIPLHAAAPAVSGEKSGPYPAPAASGRAFSFFNSQFIVTFARMIDRETVDRIYAAANIVDIIGDYVTLMPSLWWSL